MAMAGVARTRVVPFAGPPPSPHWVAVLGLLALELGTGCAVLFLAPSHQRSIVYCPRVRRDLVNRPTEPSSPYARSSTSS
jgi:hypothetical protein